MKHPFWLLNSTLLLLCFIVLGFVIFVRPQIPELESIEIEPYARTAKMATAAINLSKIYEHDLFDTYQAQPLISTEKAPTLAPFPNPPSQVPISIPAEPRPQFLDPLNITLKGIFVVLNDDSKNRAIIADNKSNKEVIYKVGDMIEDAQLVRIFSNKVLLIRSNGQQEVLYLREKDAKMDPMYASLDNWSDVVHSMGTDSYAVNIAEFTHRVQSLGQFIDMLDLTTVYSAGRGIGCRIGQLAPKSLGTALGLVKGDVITQINNIPVTDNKSRFEIYKHITALQPHDTITVNITRSGQKISLIYTLTEFAPNTKTEAAKKETEEIKQQQLLHLQEKQHFAPTLKDIIDRERKNMLEKGKRPGQDVLSNLN